MIQNKTIGVCGNSGSGKSTVCRYLALRGANVIDADEIAHELMKKGGKTYYKIISCFDNVIDEKGEIDRKKLGSIVFSSTQKLQKLNSLTHSTIAQEIKSRINKNLNVIDAPLLFEAGLDKLCTQIWAVYAQQEIRIQRVMKRDGIERADALKRFSKQKPFSEISKYADFIIDNTDGIDFKKIDSELETIIKGGI